MAPSEAGGWRELFDVALFEANRGKLRKRIELARQAINNRLDVLITERSESAKTISEHIALRDALATLTELHKIVYAPRSSASGSNHRGRAAG